MSTPGQNNPSRSGSPRKRGKRSSNQRLMLYMIFVVAVIAMVYQQMTAPPASTTATLPVPVGGEIRVYFLDVGQGDSILIQSPDNAVLIDGGEYSARKALLSYLREAGVETLDYVVATHPHSDHIGSLPVVIDEFNVRQVLMPDVTSNTTSFEKLLDAIEKKDIPVIIPEAGETFTAGPIQLTVLAPVGTAYKNVNNYSLVMQMVYGDTSFLFTGDAEGLSEEEMLAEGFDLHANILKAGHHGSDTASTDAFLEAVQARVAVISCGKNNSYGHPHTAALERFAQHDMGVYRTDESGTIVMVTDGTDISLYTGAAE